MTDTFWIIIVMLLVFKLYLLLTNGKVTSNTLLIGKTALITGGNSGLGYETALHLAGRGARVIIADCQDSTESIAKIILQTGNPNVIAKKLDLLSLNSVRQFAKEIIEEEERLDILIHNAGTGFTPGKTQDGLPAHMQVNHFGGFLLTHLLIDLLKKSSPSRIIFVSSLLAFLNDFTVDNLGEVICKKYSYNNTKFCNIVTSNMFAKKLQGTGITSNSLHPGLVATSIYRRSSPDMSPIYLNFWYLIMKFIGKTPREGAQCQIQCALSKKLTNVSGEFFVDCKQFYQPSRVRDPKLGQLVWEKSEQLVNLKPEEKLKCSY